MVARSNANLSDAARPQDQTSAALLGPKKERRLLDDLADCKRTLGERLAQDPTLNIAEPIEDPRELSRLIADTYAHHGPSRASLKAEFQRYFEIRAELVLANTRLVASIVKRYGHRGIADSDLLQEGYCGLLEAIDRFEPTRQTKLSTYATWWIRQAIQSAVAAGAYPVRLSPRHLRQLAQDQEERNREALSGNPSKPTVSESLERIQAATRSAVSLDETRFSSLPSMNDPETHLDDAIDRGEAVNEWMKTLRPRERQILSYRFGLGGSPRLSLSQVGKVLDVSKERVRQIQDVALKMIRANAARDKQNRTRTRNGVHPCVSSSE